MHKAAQHPVGKPRGVRDGRATKVQTAGTLVALVDGQPMRWVDRPLKFSGHVRLMLRKPGRTMTDIKWEQLGSQTWWRLPDWPDGEARADG
jgi:hypothetical protein